MSCNYAEGLSPYEHKGVLGAQERFDSSETIEEKCGTLTEWITSSRHVVLHTGAGISTSAGIPDFRGPNGVWTLEAKGLKPQVDLSFIEAQPTVTHMAIKRLVDEKYVHYVISQNIDGLHLRSGIRRKQMAELHGNMFVEECGVCSSQFVRNAPTSSVGKKCLDSDCRRISNGRPCRGKLFDTILDWEHSLPDKDLEMSDYHSSVADLNICLGTTLQIVPSGNLPLKSKKFGGRLVIINLQPTKHDKKADLIINGYVDDVLINIMKRLNLEIPSYCKDNDPIYTATTWNILKSDIREIKNLYDIYCKNNKKRKAARKETRLTKVKKQNEEKTNSNVIEIIDLT